MCEHVHINACISVPYIKAKINRLIVNIDGGGESKAAALPSDNCNFLIILNVSADLQLKEK